MAVVRGGGREARTHYFVRERFAKASLLECHLDTGRTHQIRVHLASAGHCIAGDDKYGDFAWNRALAKSGAKRMFLHAWSLRVKHPVSNAKLTFVAPLPDDLKFMLKSFDAAIWASY